MKKSDREDELLEPIFLEENLSPLPLPILIPKITSVELFDEDSVPSTQKSD